MELSLLDIKMLKFRPSLVAGGALYLANRLLKVSSPWPAFITQHSGHCMTTVKEAALEQYFLFQKADSQKHLQALKKKFSLNKFKEVSKLELDKQQRAPKEDTSASTISTSAKSTI